MPRCTLLITRIKAFYHENTTKQEKQVNAQNCNAAGRSHSAMVPFVELLPWCHPGVQCGLTMERTLSRVQASCLLVHFPTGECLGEHSWMTVYGIRN